MKSFAVFNKKKPHSSTKSSSAATSNQESSPRELFGIFKNAKTRSTSGAPQTKVSRRDSPTRQDGQNIEILSEQKTSCSAQVEGEQDNQGVLKKMPIKEKLEVNPTPRPKIQTQGLNIPINPQVIDEDEEMDILRDMCHLQPHEIPDYEAALPKNVVVRTGCYPIGKGKVKVHTGMKVFYQSGQRTIDLKTVAEKDSGG